MATKRFEKWGYCCATVSEDRLLTIYPDHVPSTPQLINKWFHNHSGFITGWEKFDKSENVTYRIFLAEGIRLVLNYRLEEKVVLEKQVLELLLSTDLLTTDMIIDDDDDRSSTELRQPQSFVTKSLIDCPIHSDAIRERMKTIDANGDPVEKSYLHFPVRDGYYDPECTKSSIKCQHYT